VSCPICHCARGTNVYCWGHVNSDGTGYLLPFISDMQLIEYEPRTSHVFDLKQVTLGLGESKGAGGIKK